MNLYAKLATGFLVVLQFMLFSSPSWPAEKNLKGIRYIDSETVPDTALEKAIRAFVRDEVCDKTVKQEEIFPFSYYYNKIDLNGDTRPEVLVYIKGKYFCGTGGCTLLIFKPNKDGYRLISSISNADSPVVVSERRTNGWNDLISCITGGGTDNVYAQLSFDGQGYPDNVSAGSTVNTLEINGTAYLTYNTRFNQGIQVQAAGPGPGKDDFGIKGTEVPEIHNYKKYSCYVYERYIVHVTPALDNGAGENVKVFSNPERKTGSLSCDVEPEEKVVTLKNRDAYWFAGISGEYLFIDNGTGHGEKDILVYDIAKKKRIFRSRYAGPLSLENSNSLSFYINKQTASSLNDCPERYRSAEVKERFENREPVALREKMLLNLNTLEKKHTGEIQCGSMQ